MKTAKRKILIGMVAVFILAFTMSSCSSAPIFNVKSLDELKTTLKDYPDILFPDISSYQMDGNYTVSQWDVDRSVLNGYGIYSYNPVVTGNGDLVFSRIEYSCTSLEHYGDKLNPPPSLDINAQHFGVDTQEWISDMTNDQESLDLYKVPKNTSAWLYFKKFDFNGCRYVIHAGLYLPNGGDKNKDFSAEVDQGNQELLRVMKSIIDQGPPVSSQGSSADIQGGEAQ